jgi:hypothetical protein
VYVRKIQQTSSTQVAKKERKYWRSSVERREKENERADIWG